MMRVSEVLFFGVKRFFSVVEWLTEIDGFTLKLAHVFVTLVGSEFIE